MRPSDVPRRNHVWCLRRECRRPRAVWGKHPAYKYETFRTFDHLSSRCTRLAIAFIGFYWTLTLPSVVDNFRHLI